MDLNVPIRVRESCRNSNKLEVLAGGNVKTVDKPFKDFAVVRDGVVSSRDVMQRTHRRLMGTDDLVCVEVVPVDTPIKKVGVLGRARRVGEPIDYVSYMERLYMIRPEWVKEYPTGDVRYLVFDIEALHEEHKMPDANTDMIVSIAWKFSNEPTANVIYFRGDDREIIKIFLDILRTERFDVLVGYNHKEFDIPLIIKRANFHGLEWLDVFSSPQTGVTGRKFIVSDVYEFVGKDQTLTGNVDNKKLKTVGEYFGLEFIDVDMKEINSFILNEDGIAKDVSNADIKNILEYNKSDVLLTEELYKIYAPGAYALTEFLGIDLDSSINGFTSLVGTVVMGRLLKSAGIIALGNNHDRYGKRGYLKNLTGPTGSLSYRGAIVGAPRTGYTENVYKYDFASQYPSAMVTLNMGPETTRLVDTKPLDEDIGHVKVLERGETGKLLLEIADPIIGKSLIVEINMVEKAGTTQYIEGLFSRRTEYRNSEKLAQEEGNRPDELKYHSLQWAMKVVNNAIYGYNGLTVSRYGDYIIAIVTTAFCRDLIQFLVDNIFKDRTLSLDTDGIYAEGEFQVDELNEMLTEYISNKYGIENARMRFDFEGKWPAIFVHGMKNYVLDLGSDKYKMVGCALKSSSHSIIYRDFLTAVIKTIMQKCPTLSLFVNYGNLERFPIEYFIQRKRLTTSSLYNEKASMPRDLSRKYEELTGREIAGRASIEYVVTGETLKEKQFELAVTTEISELNFAYYMNQLLKVASEFGLEFPMTRSEIFGELEC